MNAGVLSLCAEPLRILNSSIQFRLVQRRTPVRKSGRLLNLPQRLKINGEPSRARTCDPLIKSQLLYQLSYRPTTEVRIIRRHTAESSRPVESRVLIFESRQIDLNHQPVAIQI